MDRLKVDYFIDLGLLISFLTVFLTGIIKFRGWGLYDKFGFPNISLIHDWSGIVMGVLVLVHLVLHWGWIVNTTKCFFKKEEVSEDNSKD